MKSNYKQLGEIIRWCDERNRNIETSEVLGVSIGKEYMPSVANIIGTDLSNYKLVRKNRFACNPMHVGRDKVLPVALYTKEVPAIVSPAYFTFEIINKETVLPEYLMLLFCTPIFDKKCWFRTDGTVRGGISWDDLCRVELPVPDISEQRKVVTQIQAIEKRISSLTQLESQLYEGVTNIYMKWIEKRQSPFAIRGEADSVPQEWKWIPLGELIASYSRSHSFSKDSLIFLNTSDIYNGDILRDDYMLVADMPGQAKKRIQKGDILFSEIRPANRRFAYVDFEADNYVVSTKLMVLRSIQSFVSQYRIYHYLTLEKTLQELHREADAKSGTFPQITFDEDLKNRKVLIGDDKTEAALTRLLSSFYNLSRIIRSEVALITNVRNLIIQRVVEGTLS